MEVDKKLSFGEIQERLINQSKIIDKSGGESDINKIDNFNFDAFRKFSEICAFEMAKSLNEIGKLNQLPESIEIGKLNQLPESIFGQESLKSIKEYGTPFSDLHNFITWTFNNSKKFEIDDNVFTMLWKTNNQIILKPLPFSNIFINKEIEIIEGVRTFGLCLKYGLTKEKEKIMTFLIMGLDSKDKSIFFYHNSIYKEGYRGEKFCINNSFTKKETKQIDKKIGIFICNFLDFLNHPKVEIKISKWINNEQRIKKGKLPIPDKATINISGKLYKYIYEDYPQQQHSPYTNSFWVRGHYIHFWNEKNYHKLYSLSQKKLEKEDYYLDKDNVICKWVLPYIKCKDKPLKDKVYEIK